MLAFDALENFFDVFERRPFVWLERPTLRHEAVQPWRTFRRQRQPLTIFDFADYVVVLNTLKRFHAHHQNLPHTYTKHPDVAGRCKPSEVDRLR